MNVRFFEEFFDQVLGIIIFDLNMREQIINHFLISINLLDLFLVKGHFGIAEQFETLEVLFLIVLQRLSFEILLHGFHDHLV